MLQDSEGYWAVFHLLGMPRGLPLWVRVPRVTSLSLSLFPSCTSALSLSASLLPEVTGSVHPRGAVGASVVTTQLIPAGCAAGGRDIAASSHSLNPKVPTLLPLFILPPAPQVPGTFQGL